MAKVRTKVVPIPVPVRAPMRPPMVRTPMVPPQAAPVPGVPPMGMGAPGGAMKKGGKVHKYAAGGKMKSMKESMGPKTMSKDVEGPQANRKFGESKLQKRGQTDGVKVKMAGNTIGTGKAKAMCGGGMKKMAKGGSTSSRADGIAQRGKTKTKYC